MSNQKINEMVFKTHLPMFALKINGFLSRKQSYINLPYGFQGRYSHADKTISGFKTMIDFEGLLVTLSK